MYDLYLKSRKKSIQFLFLTFSSNLKMKHIAKRDHVNFNNLKNLVVIAKDLNAFVFDTIILNVHSRAIIIILN